MRNYFIFWNAIKWKIRLSLGDKSQQKARNDLRVSQLSRTEKSAKNPLTIRGKMAVFFFFFFFFFLLLLLFKKTLQKKTFSELINRTLTPILRPLNQISYYIELWLKTNRRDSILSSSAACSRRVSVSINFMAESLSTLKRKERWRNDC